MTEDDTFRKLKQIPLEQMKQICHVWFDCVEDKRKLTQLLDEHGWTYEEWDEKYPVCGVAKEWL